MGESILNQYLKNYRLSNNLSQQEMSKKLKTSQTYYSQIETGAKKPGIQFVNRLAKVLKVEPSVIRSML